MKTDQLDNGMDVTYTEGVPIIDVNNPAETAMLIAALVANQGGSVTITIDAIMETIRKLVDHDLAFNVADGQMTISLLTRKEREKLEREITMKNLMNKVKPGMVN